MAQWMMWMTAAGLLVILEIFTGTFYLLMIALGLIAGAIAAYAGLANPLQLLLAALVGAGATVVLKRSKLTKVSRLDAARDPNMNLDIGQLITVDQWTLHPGGVPTARVMYRGAQWDVRHVGHGELVPGEYQIKEIRGSCLLVAHHAA